jgi:arylsulfatase A-like enzyme
MQRLLVLLAALLLVPQAALRATDAPKPSKPNIVFILADDLGYSDVGFLGGKDIQTPHLDKLAHAGTILDSFYVQPVCSPTRAALMTGRYPIHNGVYTAVTPQAHWGLPLQERTLPSALQQAGYETAICGKWHLGMYQREYQPTKRGFDHQYGLWFGEVDYFTHTLEGIVDWHRDDQPCADEGYSTHLLAREACRRIREQQPDKRLFLYVPFNAVHGPHAVPESYMAPYQDLPQGRRIYAGMLAALDEAVGQIVAELETQQLRENTLIVFSSDNGGTSTGRNRPLRAGKNSLYEGGIRVCAFASWPGHIPSEAIVHEPLHIVDWYPTLLRLAGASQEQELPLDGVDIWSVLTQGTKSPHESILISGENPSRAAFRVGDWKLLLNQPLLKSEANKKIAKPVENGENESVLLFNLADDLGETTDVAAKHPDKLHELRAKLDVLLAGAALPGNLAASRAKK